VILDWSAFITRTVEAATEFHTTFGLPVGGPVGDSWRVRRTLLAEGYSELVHAANSHQLLDLADALADLSYVIAGTAVAYGLSHENACHAYGPYVQSSQPAVRTFDGAFAAPPAVDIWVGRFTAAYGQYYTQSTGGGKIDAWQLVLMQHAVASIAVICGIPLDAMFDEVHQSNMSKTKTVATGAGEDGKAVKGPDYKSPNLPAALTAYHVTPIVRGLLASDRRPR
jgi:hypothetical protein